MIELDYCFVQVKDERIHPNIYIQSTKYKMTELGYCFVQMKEYVQTLTFKVQIHEKQENLLTLSSNGK